MSFRQKSVTMAQKVLKQQGSFQVRGPLIQEAVILVTAILLFGMALADVVLINHIDEEAGASKIRPKAAIQAWIFFYNMPMPFLSCAHAIAHIALVRLRIISTLGKKSAYLTGLLSFILLGWFLQESWWIVCLLDSTKYEDAVDEYPTDNYCFLVAVGSMKSSYESGDSDVEQIIAIFKFTVACAILIEYIIYFGFAIEGVVRSSRGEKGPIKKSQKHCQRCSRELATAPDSESAYELVDPYQPKTMEA